MKKTLCVALLAAACGTLWAEDDAVFLSISRRPERLERQPTNVSVITPADIERLGAHTLDEVLPFIAGADVNRTGTLGTFSTLRLRGLPSSAQVQVVVDDQPLGGVSTQFVDLSQIPLDDVERIEVVRGGSSVLFGANTIGGVVHIITKRHRNPRPLSYVGLEGRSFKTQIYRGGIGALGHGFDGRVDASRYFTDGFQKNSDGDNVSVSGRGGYTFRNGARLSLDAARTDSETGDPQGTSLPLDEWDGSRERDPLDRTARVEQEINTGRFKAEAPLGSLGKFESTVYGSDQRYLSTSSAFGNPPFELKNIIVGNDTRFLFPFGLTLGGSYERDERHVNDAAPHHITNWGAYAQQTLSVGRLDLLPAVRLDQHSAFGNIVNPRFTAVYKAGEKWKVSGNAARSFRAPTLSQLYEDFPAFPPFSGPFVGNRDLKPETAVTYDLGVEHRASSVNRLAVTGFYTRLRDRIYGTSDPFPAANMNRNAPRAEISGAEVEAVQTFGRLESRTNYTYQRALGNSAGASGYKALALTPRHLASHELILSLKPGWRFINVLRYTHKEYQSDGEQGAKIASRAVWDFRITRRILAAEAFFAVKNITNRHDAESFSFGSTLIPAPKRNFEGGITVRFRD